MFPKSSTVQYTCTVDERVMESCAFSTAPSNAKSSIPRKNSTQHGMMGDVRCKGHRQIYGISMLRVGFWFVFSLIFYRLPKSNQSVDDNLIALNNIVFLSVCLFCCHSQDLECSKISLRSSLFQGQTVLKVS